MRTWQIGWPSRVAIRWHLPLSPPLSHRQSLIWIKGRNPFEGFFEVTELSSFSRAAKGKEPLGGSLALAGNELLEQRTWTKFLPRMICERLRESCLSNDSGE